MTQIPASGIDGIHVLALAKHTQWKTYIAATRVMLEACKDLTRRIERCVRASAIAAIAEEGEKRALPEKEGSVVWDRRFVRNRASKLCMATSLTSTKPKR